MGTETIHADGGHYSNPKPSNHKQPPTSRPKPWAGRPGPGPGPNDGHKRHKQNQMHNAHDIAY